MDFTDDINDFSKENYDENMIIKTLGEYLKEIRESRGLSQRDLAEAANISNAEVSRIENGLRQRPSPDVLKALSMVLNLSYIDLLNRASYESGIKPNWDRIEYEEQMMSIMFPKLILDGWTVRPSGDSSIADLFATKYDENWAINFMYYKSIDDSINTTRDTFFSSYSLYMTFGRLCLYNKKPITKFSIATNSKRLFEFVNTHPPRHLDMKISVYLLDIENRMVTDELEC